MVNRAIWKELQGRNIYVAYPQREVRMLNAPSSLSMTPSLDVGEKQTA
jgi:small-conductance mechanosensitive channel